MAPSIYHCVILSLHTREIFSIRLSVAIVKRKWFVSAFRFPLRPQSPETPATKSHFLSVAFNFSLRNDFWSTYKTCTTSLKQFEKIIIWFVDQSYCQTHLYWRGINHDLWVRKATSLRCHFSATCVSPPFSVFLFHNLKKYDFRMVTKEREQLFTKKYV